MSTLENIASVLKKHRAVVLAYLAAALVAAAGFGVGYRYAKQEALPIVIEKCPE